MICDGKEQWCQVPGRSTILVTADALILAFGACCSLVLEQHLHTLCE